MDLQTTVMDVLRSSGGQSLTIDDVAAGVAERMKDDIRTTLNDLTKKGQISTHVGGRDHLWRYQAKPLEPFKLP
jgi:predicted transcriptional regulator